VLYELLTGEPPFQGRTAMAVLLRVMERPPRRPAQCNPRVPADLETVCLKCLEKEPHRRYQSALELAEDLERWRNGEPVLARPAAPWERAWRWARRHPFGAGLSLVTALALVLAVVTLALSNARIARQEGETARALAQEQQARDRERRQVYLARVALAYRLWSENRLGAAGRLLDECPPEFRHWEWHYVYSLLQTHLASLEHPDLISALAYSRDGQTLAAADVRGAVRLWDGAGRRLLRSLPGHGRPVTDLAFRPDGRRLVSAGGQDRTGRLWDVETGQEILSLPGVRGLVERVAFSPDGSRITGACQDLLTWQAGPSTKEADRRAHGDRR
jgi:eukaryotic-like serine/threonine-protein kinase